MPHVLIVEDEPTTAWALAEGLSDDGFTIDTFRSAEEACAWLAQGRSDAVITDLRLRGMSGLALARKLARGPHAQPVIVVTAYGGAETEAALRRAGVFEIFPKPFRMDLLRRALRRALEQSARRRSTPRRIARDANARRRAA